MKKILSSIKSQSELFRLKTDDELNYLIEKLKKRGIEQDLNSIIIDWYALVQEISFRKIGLRHFETQLLAGLFLHEGKIVEMKTGEGKTLSSTLPISLNALTKKGVHVVTVNDYLAERDYNWMGKIYKGLGLSSGLVTSTNSLKEKQLSYNSDLTYVTNSEVVFDYLRDSSSYEIKEIVQRPFSFCIIDEIDSILIDEARTPLIISEYEEKNNFNKLLLSNKIANLLKKEIHFEINEQRKEINLTEEGYIEVKKQLGITNLYNPEDPWILEILNALKANSLFRKNEDYIVLNQKVVIIDSSSGRIMEDRRWSMGIHEAIEMKENVEIRGGTTTKTSITYQNFFALYPKLSGMTGTGKTAEKEFSDIYGLKVVVVPTFKPMIRKDLPDLIYQKEKNKWDAVLKTAKNCYKSGQPLLIGTASIEKSEFLSDLLKSVKIPHDVLNAKPENVTRESEIIAQAGEQFRITIATNMAGRGTDIILGGNPNFKTKKKLIEFILENKEDLLLDFSFSSSEKLSISQLVLEINEKYKDKKEILIKELNNLPYSLEKCEKELTSLYTLISNKIILQWEKENKIVKNLGGLFVLGTERHETRRIDNQLRGRAGRQGDPGIAQFFVSLDDNLFKIFGGQNIRNFLSQLMDDPTLPMESSFLTKSLENAQAKVESLNYETRKNVFQYDDVLNMQRNQIFKIRRAILFSTSLEKLFLSYHEFDLDKKFSKLLLKKKNKEDLLNAIKNLFDFYSLTGLEFENINTNKKKKEISLEFYKLLWIKHDYHFSHGNTYQLGFHLPEQTDDLLSFIDKAWTEHLEKMSYIRETINWKSYGQKNPLTEYNVQSCESFKLLYEKIRLSVIYYFQNSPINHL